MTNLAFDTRMLESLPDGVMVLEKNLCIYANPEHRRLWLGTDYLIIPRGEYNAINPTVDQLVISRNMGAHTIQVNKGSSIYYYYLYCFPVNCDYYFILTRDVTQLYLESERDKEYRDLFNATFSTIRFPLAIVDNFGIVNRFTPAFAFSFSDVVTLSSGNFIWDFFTHDRPAVKELFEEMVKTRQPFERNGFHFVPVSDRWIEVYSHSDAHTNKGTEDNIQDYLTFFKVLSSFKNWPWKTILIVAVFLTTLIGKIDPNVLIQLLNGTPTIEETQP